jgi:3-dehydroquinate dehydratase/shikimate dehydrogenase
VIPKINDKNSLIDYEADLELPLDLRSQRWMSLRERAIASRHNFDETSFDVAANFDLLAGCAGATIKFASLAEQSTDAIDMWKLLERGRAIGKRVIPIAMGEAGKWTRILGLAHGAPMTYAKPQTGDETAPGQITVEEMTDVFRVKELDRETKVFGIIAGDTSYSLSPFMHNPAFQATGLNSVFVPFMQADVGAFVQRMVRRTTREVELNPSGFSVTNPHKQTVIEHLDEIDDTARRIGAVNTIQIDGDVLRGFNTDVIGFIGPLKEKLGDIRGSSATVAGAGGAARACIHALQEEGSDVTLLARESPKARKLSEEFGVSFRELTTGAGQLQTDILVNATPLGTKGETVDKTIAVAEELSGVKLVYDLVYNPTETMLIKEAKKAGVETLGGLDMLIAQGAVQFKIWTGNDAPVDVMRTGVRRRLGI